MAAAGNGDLFQPEELRLPLDERLARFRCALEALCLGHRIWLESIPGGLGLVVDPLPRQKTGLQTEIRLLRSNEE